MNDFKKISQPYQKTKEKPDKRFSILPTILSLLSPLKGMRVVDLGCGSGFFTEEIARRNAKAVYGLDNCQAMLSLAPARDNTFYLEKDIFEGSFPECDVINAPFVLNYANSREELFNIILRCARSMKEGRLVAVLDEPLKEKSESILERLKEIGAVKKVKGKLKDGADIEIDLWTMESKCCTLHSKYYSKETVEGLMKEAGFKRITWHKPFIVKEGIAAFGSKLWEGYQDICELSYVKAEK